MGPSGQCPWFHQCIAAWCPCGWGQIHHTHRAVSIQKHIELVKDGVVALDGLQGWSMPAACIFGLFKIVQIQHGDLLVVVSGMPSCTSSSGCSPHSPDQLVEQVVVVVSSGSSSAGWTRWCMAVPSKQTRGRWRPRAVETLFDEIQS